MIENIFSILWDQDSGLNNKLFNGNDSSTSKRVPRGSRHCANGQDCMVLSWNYLWYNKTHFSWRVYMLKPLFGVFPTDKRIAGIHSIPITDDGSLIMVLG